MSKKMLLQTNKTEPVLLEKKPRKLTGERYYYNPINFLPQSEANAVIYFYNYIRGGNTALRKVLEEKEVGLSLYFGESRNGNVHIEIDTTITIRKTEIKDPNSKTLPLEIAEALDIAKTQAFTALYENNDEFGNKMDFDEYLETAINYSKHKDEEYLEEFWLASVYWNHGNDLYDWYKLYCEKVKPIYVEEFMWLVMKAYDEDKDDQILYSPDTPWPPIVKLPSDSNFYNNFRNNPNPFTKEMYKNRGFYKL